MKRFISSNYPSYACIIATVVFGMIAAYLRITDGAAPAILVFLTIIGVILSTSLISNLRAIKERRSQTRPTYNR